MFNLHRSIFADYLFTMKKYLNSVITAFSLFAIVLIASCVKDESFDENPSLLLKFSQDTVLFDTIFTTVGSATQIIKIYNPSANKIRVSSIKLGKGKNSPYTFNIDGITSDEIKDLEIQGKDSAFVFIKVTIDPGDENAPFIQQDSLVFNTNSNIQDIKLIAWGQDAYFYNGAILGSDYIFEADKPHVIYKYLIVDSLYTLHINAGAKVHMHPGAFILVYNSASLKIKGTIDNPVTIEGDRMEDSFKEMPGQWNRIWLYPGSINNEIEYAIIKNGETGIQVDTIGNSTNSTLRISNTKIFNMTQVGLLAQGSTVEAANCVISNCGSYAVSLALGGSYDFRHCTIGNYWQGFQRESGILLNNYYTDINNNLQERPLQKAYFGNCIIYGVNDDEITLDKSPQGAVFNYIFDHCVIKTTLSLNDATHFMNSTRNEEPYFKDPFISDFEPDSTLSSVIDKGSLQVINEAVFNLQTDISNRSRISDEAPDAGAYEFLKR